jgi:hypothetical protein
MWQWVAVVVQELMSMEMQVDLGAVAEIICPQVVQLTNPVILGGPLMETLGQQEQILPQTLVVVAAEVPGHQVQLDLAQLVVQVEPVLQILSQELA